MFEWFKKLFGKKPDAITTETITIQVADEVSLIESTPVEVEVEVTKKKSAPKTPKEKIKVKKEAVKRVTKKAEKPTPKKRGRPARAK